MTQDLKNFVYCQTIIFSLLSEITNYKNQRGECLLIAKFLKIDQSTFKVALYTILQRFECHICLNNFSLGKCSPHSTLYRVNNKYLQH